MRFADEFEVSLRDAMAEQPCAPRPWLVVDVDDPNLVALGFGLRCRILIADFDD
jgi:hypothetical protein